MAHTCTIWISVICTPSPLLVQRISGIAPESCNKSDVTHFGRAYSWYLVLKKRHKPSSSHLFRCNKSFIDQLVSDVHRDLNRHLRHKPRSVLVKRTQARQPQNNRPCDRGRFLQKHCFGHPASLNINLIPNAFQFEPRYCIGVFLFADGAKRWRSRLGERMIRADRSWGKKNGWHDTLLQC